MTNKKQIVLEESATNVLSYLPMKKLLRKQHQLLPKRGENLYKHNQILKSHVYIV